MNNAESVKYHISQKDDEVKLVFINSICSCAAGNTKPEVSIALKNKIIRDKLFNILCWNGVRCFRLLARSLS